ncbi:hypothetical protein FRC12_017090 [Ceratobasidium sp. 428]|nr:hypothetical protein FRC09_006237 [Ceratobasidium sp. 395]KAG8785854.1 hypothetical protein FRC12_017090 [Ceratobasidium sp. 428]
MRSMTITVGSPVGLHAIELLKNRRGLNLWAKKSTKNKLYYEVLTQTNVVCRSFLRCYPQSLIPLAQCPAALMLESGLSDPVFTNGRKIRANEKY